ncbi:MFS transporter [Ktedonosporobacter rubrisoli]|nr:MFS transporter [Ktedonosporobacter rubrisoli]
MQLPTRTKRVSFTLPASLHPLTEKYFSIFWAGAFLSSIGFWIQAVGEGWLVLQLTNSALLLGLVTFAATLPNVVLSLFGGAIADRVNRRYLLIITQSVYLSSALTIGILTTLHLIQVWMIILIALINGTFSSVGFPAWQTFISELVSPGELKQGIALNSMQFNLSRVIGPAIGGISVGVLGVAGSYYLNALSYVAILIPLLVMRPALRMHTSAERQSIWQGVREGLSYVRKLPSLQLALVLQFVIVFLVFPYATLLPIFANNIFHIGAQGLGLLNSAAGIGALCGSVLVVLRSQRMEYGPRALIILGIVGGSACAAFAMAHSLQLALLLLLVVGACAVMASTITNTTVQTMVPEEMRGRVLSLWVLSSAGIGPFGNLVAGWVAQYVGAPITLMLSGGLCAIIALIVLCWRMQLKPRMVENSIDSCKAVSAK